MDNDIRRDRERTLLAVPGATFFDRNGETMFQFVIDGGSIIGPRLAKEADKAQYPGEYAAFLKDHDLESADDRSERGNGIVDPQPLDSGGIDGPASDPAPRPRKPGRPRKL